MVGKGPQLGSSLEKLVPELYTIMAFSSTSEEEALTQEKVVTWSPRAEESTVGFIFFIVLPFILC